MSRRAPAPVPALLAAALLLTGCGGEERPAAGASPTAATSSATSSATPSAGGSSSPTGSDDGDAGTVAPSSPADTRPDTADASADASVTVRDVRTGRHDGFDRVVFEAGGTGTPGWDVRYVDVASSQGSGEEVEVAGEAVLQVTITGAGYPYDTGVEEYAGPDPLPGEGTATVTEVVFDATFEGTTVAFVGTRSQAPFRVYALEDPTRVVVEVADAG
ncbi:AMIN-like domain-containing (lipo)protein [Geodermatophilus sp. SYSU D01036]